MTPESVARLVQQKLTPGLLVYLQPVILLFMAGAFLQWSTAVAIPLKFLLVAFGVVALGISLFLVIWVILMHRWSKEIAVLMEQRAFETVNHSYGRFAFSRREKEHYAPHFGEIPR
ncbi:hypothetical protein [Deinococcus cellulosilyticus]|uniref:Uncharacterized protein n=1 Tax=Deinococcus cellulosilyticus (strain DSM 18568 / NBRC 106333 / KACC 11606 / 5516J-15) TaxID=1223518 RepID=A0A511N399_DEIC1|nr:hypothetical protein [Deinococcus cellulosilyticus]GEM47339.1 hypothetical protein DC3_29740 [Deinococcus cellulosilyticus NBRC 106333 = KACC 11606]